jgi:hypothetical protein
VRHEGVEGVEHGRVEMAPATRTETIFDNHAGTSTVLVPFMLGQSGARGSKRPGRGRLESGWEVKT